MRAMRGQMFIITMVFLAGLVVFVSQLLMSYSSVDVSDIPDRTATFVASEYVDMINETIRYSRNCTDANRSVMEMNAFLQRLVTENYHSNVLYDRELVPCVDCEKYNDLSGEEKLFKVDMEVVTGTSEVMGEYDIYREFIVFGDVPSCNPETGNIQEKELWCKSEDPEEPGACKANYLQTIDECKSCVKMPSGDDIYTSGYVVSSPDCTSMSQLACPPTVNTYDQCDAVNNEMLREASCIDGESAYTNIDCGVSDSVVTTCQLDPAEEFYGDIVELNDDWFCATGTCDNLITYTQIENCQPAGQCVEGDGGKTPNTASTTSYYPPCTMASMACPAMSSGSDYCTGYDRVMEYYCTSTQTMTNEAMDCDQANAVSHGWGCENNACYDCDEDGDDWCACPEDGDLDPGREVECDNGGGYYEPASYDCAPSCSQVYPGATYQNRIIGICSWDSGYKAWDFNCDRDVEPRYERCRTSTSGCTQNYDCDGVFTGSCTNYRTYSGYYGSSNGAYTTVLCGYDGLYVIDGTCVSGTCNYINTQFRTQSCV